MSINVKTTCCQIKTYLHENGITQSQLSQSTGISTARLNQILNGSRGMKLEDYALICGALGVNTDKFLKPIVKTKD